MNTEAMRQNIAEAKARLEAIEDEREALASFIDGAERVLSLPIALSPRVSCNHHS